MIQTQRDRGPCMLDSQPSVPVTAYAAARGAVTAEDSPAARRPTEKNVRAQGPSSGSSCTAMSAAVAISAPLAAPAAVTTTAMLTTPPNRMDSNASRRAAESDSGPDQRSRTAVA